MKLTWSFGIVFSLYFGGSCLVVVSDAFAPRCCRVPTMRSNTPPTTTTELKEMKRPLLDQLASTLFRLETDRVEKSSVIDEQGRYGEPMDWSESNSWANQFSNIMADNAYGFKQFVADIVAGSDYDKDATMTKIDTFVDDHPVAMFSFTTCPFCRRAKDYFDANGIAYTAMELDELDGNEGNEIRAMLGRKTKRTSVPSIFVGGQCIGGCNDGPGLLPLAETGELYELLEKNAISKAIKK